MDLENAINNSHLELENTSARYMAGETGLEPATLGFGDRCSTS